MNVLTYICVRNVCLKIKLYVTSGIYSLLLLFKDTGIFKSK
jgi:hypothetical protein